MMTVWTAGAILVSFFMAWLFALLLCRLAPRIGFVAHPTDDKNHGRVVPVLGGVAIGVGFMTGVAVLALSPQQAGAETRVLLVTTLCALLAGALDDRWALTPRPKIALMVAACCIPALVGVLCLRMSVGWGLAAIALMFVLMNSLNLLDNSDGCCAMVSLCILLTAALSRWTPVTPMLLAAAAAIGGFLMTNWPPARLFMGDAGSLLLGAWCAILALMPPASAPAVKWHLVPAFWVPAYDTLSVIVLRLARGRPVWIGGQDHLAHRLRRRGLRPAWVVAVFAAATLAAGGIGLALPGPHGVLLLLGLLAVSGAAEWLFWKARRG